MFSLCHKYQPVPWDRRSFFDYKAPEKAHHVSCNIHWWNTSPIFLTELPSMGCYTWFWSSAFPCVSIWHRSSPPRYAPFPIREYPRRPDRWSNRTQNVPYLTQPRNINLLWNQFSDFRIFQEVRLHLIQREPDFQNGSFFIHPLAKAIRIIFLKFFRYLVAVLWQHFFEVLSQNS